MPERIVLSGFMGSGKSTVGRAVAGALGWRFRDLDDAVSEAVGLSVPAIFAQRGEAAFRDQELRAFVDLLQERQTVIALGGGALETAALRERLAGAPLTAVIFLHVPFPVLLERCGRQQRRPDAVRRPLFDDPQAVAARYQRRLPVYQGTSHHVIAEAAEPVHVLVQQVLARLGLRAR